MSDVFISYATPDRPWKDRLAAALKQEGWSVWSDVELQPGTIFDEAIAKALAEARCVIVLWSARSVESGWVKDEAQQGLDRRVLVPALIDRVAIPLGFGRVQAARLEGWTGDRADPEFRKLCDAIEAKVARSGAVAVAPAPPGPAGGGSGLGWKVALAAALVAAVAAGAWVFSRPRRSKVGLTVPSTMLPSTTMVPGTTTTTTPDTTAPSTTTTVPTTTPTTIPSPSPRGDQAVVVPNLVGLTLREAVGLLTRAGLAREIEYRSTNNEAEQSRVIEQSPSANATAAPGSSVKLTAFRYDSACRAFNPRAVALQEAGGSWRVMEGDQVLFDFGEERDQARLALSIIGKYGLDQSCALRGGPGQDLRYLLVRGEPPTGALPNEDCSPFDPAAVTLQETSSGWTLRGDGLRFNFNRSEGGEARKALGLIKRFGLTHSCRVGRPFRYLRR